MSAAAVLPGRAAPLKAYAMARWTRHCNRRRRYEAAVGSLAIVLLVGVIYYPALWGAFVWDDVIFAEEPVIRSATGLWNIWFSPGDIKNEGHYWPIVYTTFWLEDKAWGSNPVGYHAFNVALHAVNSLLVWRLSARLAVPGAWLVAAVFAAHPLHVESVAWIIERKDVLSGLFYLTAALAWIRFAEAGGPGRYVLAFILFIAGMLSKSVVVTLPAALVIWHWWRSGTVTVWDGLRVAPLLLTGLAIAYADYGFYHSREVLDLGYSLAERILIGARALWFYVGKLVWPADLAIIHPLWEIDIAAIAAWAFVAAAAALAAGLWAARRRYGRGPFAGALFFAVTLSPVLGFVDYGYMQFSFVADRFQYLAGFGALAVLVGVGVRGAVRLPATGRRAAGVLAALLLAVLATLTWRLAGVYRDEVTLFSHIVAHNPNARDAHLNLGSALLGAGRVDEGLEASRIAAVQRPDTAGPLANIGRGLLAQERFTDAEQTLVRALALEPRDLSALQNLAEVRRRLGRVDEAEAGYRAVLAIDSDYALAHAGLGHMLAAVGRHEEGLEHLTRAVTLQPGLSIAPALYVQMAIAARELGRLDDAEAHLLRAIALRPQDRGPHLELAVLYALQGRHAEAEAQRHKARELLAGDPAALHTYAESLRKELRLEEAIATYEEALAANPDFAPAHAGLGLALYEAKHYSEAVETMSQALELDPGLAVAASLRVFSGHALRKLGRRAEADAQYELALDLAPRNADALDYLAMSLFSQERYEEALRHYRTLARINTTSAVTHSNLGAALHYLDRNEEALVSVERALALDPDLELALVGRAAIRQALGERP